MLCAVATSVAATGYEFVSGGVVLILSCSAVWAASIVFGTAPAPAEPAASSMLAHQVERSAVPSAVGQDEGVQR